MKLGARRTGQTACALGSMLLVSCGDPNQGSGAVPTSQGEGRPEEEQAPDFDTLSQLGYADWSDEDASEGHLQGVVHHEPELSCPGYDLFVNLPDATVVLMSVSGNELQRWTPPEPSRGLNARLMPSGDLLLIGRDHSPDAYGEGYLARMSWEGELDWKADIGAHHDVEPLTGDRLIVLTEKVRYEFEPWKHCGLRDMGVLLMDGAGRTIKELFLYPSLASDPDRLQLVHGKAKKRTSPADVLHVNSVDWIEGSVKDPLHPAHGRRVILMAVRHQHAVAMVDWDDGSLVWAWGQGRVLFPHDARLLGNGNVLLFDNGAAQRPWSRILEVDPRTDKVVWRYRAENPEDFYSEARGTCQRLANGNTLVSESDEGSAFEVTPEGRVVWRFLSPFRGEASGRGRLRMEHYEPAYVEAILERH